MPAIMMRRRGRKKKVQYREEITSSRSWTSPISGQVDLVLHGGGGGGGSGYGYYGMLYNGGGGGSGYVVTKSVVVEKGQVIPITIGTGGNAGTFGTPGTAGGTGGVTSFSTLASASGGTGGKAASNQGPGAGGAGGNSGSSTGVGGAGYSPTIASGGRGGYVYNAGEEGNKVVQAAPGASGICIIEYWI